MPEFNPIKTERLLTVDKPYFYPINTVNNTFFLEENHQTHSDLGTNNLVPHVHVITWMQVCNRLLFRVKKLYMKVGLPPRMANWKTNFTFINLRASGDNVQKMGTLVGSADPTFVGPAPPLC